MGDQIAAMADFAEAAKKTNYPPGSIGPRSDRGAPDLSADNLSDAMFVAGQNRESAAEYFDKMSVEAGGYQPRVVEDEE